MNYKALNDCALMLTLMAIVAACLMLSGCKVDIEAEVRQDYFQPQVTTPVIRPLVEAPCNEYLTRNCDFF